MKKEENALKQRIGNKGYVMILDAIIALTVLLMVFSVVVSVHDSPQSSISSTSFKEIHYLSEDILDVLNKQGALDEIGTYWAAANGSTTTADWSSATNVSRQYLDKLISKKYGYRIEIDGASIYDSNQDPASGRPGNASVTSETHSSRLLVGYGKGQPTRGQVARAYLSNIGEKVTSTYAYFGGFEGEGELTKKVDLPDGMDTIKSICLEYDAGDDFDLAIDGTAVPIAFVKSPGSMAAVYQCIPNPTAYISPGFGGTHNFTITFNSGDMSTNYIGGGYIKIDYNTSEFDDSPDIGISRYDFPGIDGLINLYSSFYVPGYPLNSMSMHLRFDNNYTTYLDIGNVEVFNTTSASNRKFCTITPDNRSYTCDIPNANLSKMFGGPPYPAYLAQNTIPVRMGARNISGVAGMQGTADVVLITDISGSMTNCVSNDNSCSSPNRRIDVAKTLDDQFIESILDGSGNRIGLVSFNTGTSSKGLTTDIASLETTVNGYTANGGTCLCCAINSAMALFNDSLVLLQNGSDWQYKINRTCGNSCDPTATAANCTVSGWQNQGFNDTSWATWNPVTTGDNLSAVGSVVYYRKHINVTYSSIAGNATLKIRNQKGVQCYFNGYSIVNDTACDNATYWDSSWAFSKTYFNSSGTDNVLACRVRSGTSSGKTGTAFNAMITASQKRYIIVMTDGVTGFSCGECGSNPGCSNPAGLCSGSCTQTSADSSQWGPDYQCSGTPPGSCTDSNCQPAINDAICSARRAYNNYFVKLYSVGFGPVATCSNGQQTLQNIAQCGNGSYYASSDANQLQMIYNDIAQEILNETNKSQTINITGGTVEPSILYPESYIQFGYTPISNATYGEISLTANTTLFTTPTNCNSNNLNISSIITAVSDAKVTSYSSEHWTDYLKVNSNPIFNLSTFDSDYSTLGDPYMVQIPPQNIHPGSSNSINLSTGDSPAIKTNCSIWDQVIYTMRLSGRVSYGDVFPDKNGCNWTIEFFGGTILNQNIPSTYTGNKTCFYTSSNHGRGTNVSSDAVNDAIYRLLDGLDAANDGVVDVRFDPSMVEFAFSQAGGVRSLWGPINVKLVIWM